MGCESPVPLGGRAPSCRSHMCIFTPPGYTAIPMGIVDEEPLARGGTRAKGPLGEGERGRPLF